VNQKELFLEISIPYETYGLKNHLKSRVFHTNSQKIFYFFKRLIKTLFSNGFFEKKEVKGIKVSVKGRLNGARRKGKYILEYGQTSVQTLKDKVSYHQEDSFTLFGVLGIKVWIIY